MKEMIASKELMTAIGACNTGPDFIEENNLWGQPESVVLPALLNAGLTNERNWFLNAKKTEAYVRFNGKEFTLGAYQVFNPLTGLHTRYDTEAEATDALIQVAKQVLVQQCPTVCQELTNENGDSCWTAIDFSNKYDVVKV